MFEDFNLLVKEIDMFKENLSSISELKKELTQTSMEYKTFLKSMCEQGEQLTDKLEQVIQGIPLKLLDATNEMSQIFTKSMSEIEASLLSIGHHLIENNHQSNDRIIQTVLSIEEDISERLESVNTHISQLKQSLSLIESNTIKSNRIRYTFVFLILLAQIVTLLLVLFQN